MSSTATPGTGRVMDDAGNLGELERIPRGADPFDALRDLFLGDDEPEARRPAAATPAPAPHVSPAALEEPELVRPDPQGYPLVDALILGHLPVLQSPWVTQYAREAASQRDGPVAILRVFADEITIDLIGLSHPAGASSQRATLDEALDFIAPIARGIIVRVDATSEPALAELDSIDSLTLLTGADEVAILAAYTTVKKLLAKPDDSSPHARLAIMGSSPEKAFQAASKLEKTAALHLQRGLTVTACIARISHGRLSPVYRGPVSHGLKELLAKAREALLRPRTRRPVPAARPPVESVEAPVAYIPTQHQPAAAPIADDPVPIPERTAVVSRLGHAASAAAPARGLSQATSSITAAPSESPRPLHAHIRGLTGTPRIVSPAHPGIEVAVDARGGLHLLAYADGASAIGTSVTSLVAVSSWAKAHASLIALAMQGLGVPFDGHQPVTLHLLTPTVKEGRGLSEAGLHIHLLTRVEIEGRQGWFCTEVG